MRAERAG